MKLKFQSFKRRNGTYYSALHSIVNKKTVFFFIVSTLPILMIINWKAIYGFFSIIILYSFLFYIVENKTPHISFPFLYLLKIFLLSLMLIIYLDQPGTVANILAILLIETTALWLVAGIYPALKPEFFRSLAYLCVFNMAFYFVLSVFFSAFIPVENPVRDFFSGQRVRLLAFDTGHSIMIDLSFLCMIIGLSNIAALGLWRNILMITISALGLALSKSGGAILILCLCIYVFSVEWSPLPKLLRLIFYIPILLFLELYFLEPNILDNILIFVRINLQGVDPSAYANNDFTAGRSDLNRILIEFIQNHFWIGGGHEHPLIQYGTNIYSSLVLTQESTAVVESSLRNAAKYGMPYFILIVGFILQPCLTALRTSDRRIRIFCVSLSLGLLSLSAVNSQFEVPHEPQHFLYFSLLAISIHMHRVFRDDHLPSQYGHRREPAPALPY